MEELKTYQRKVTECKAIRVTKENIYDVAKWCKGVVRNAGIVEAQLYIDTMVSKDKSFWRTMIYVGDWVTSDGDEKFMGYPNDVFRSEFEVDDRKPVCTWPNCLDEETRFEQRRNQFRKKEERSSLVLCIHDCDNTAVGS